MRKAEISKPNQIASISISESCEPIFSEEIFNSPYLHRAPQNFPIINSSIVNNNSLNEQNSINSGVYSKSNKKYSINKKNSKKLSCLVDEKLKKKIEEKIEIMDASPNSKNLQKNSIYIVLQSQFPKVEFLKYLIFRYFLPFPIFTILILAMLYIHIYVIKDYCYYENLCRCQSLGVYIYTMIREILQYYCVIIIMLYFSVEFLTDNFFGKKKIKWAYCLIQFIPEVCVYVYYYPHANETAHALVRRYSVLSIVIMDSIFLLFFLVILKKVTKKIIGKLLKFSLFTAYFYFHCYSFKTSSSYYILQFLENNFQKDLALNLFKLFLLFYLIIYQFVIKNYLFYLYKDIVTSNIVPCCLIINLLRFMSIDILSIQIMNVLSIPLNEIFSWISFANYIYSLISIYSGTDIIGTIFYRIMYWLINKQKQKNSLISTKFKEIRSACVLEANLIIFLRMIILKMCPHYFLFSKKVQLFYDCTLKIKTDSFTMNDENIAFVIVSHTLLVAVIFFFMVKKKKAWIHLNSERFWEITRLVNFLGLFSMIDYDIQFYDSLGSLNGENF